jgi:hypothetical protein
MLQKPAGTRGICRIQKHRANGGQEWRGFGYIGLPGPIHRSERQAIRTVQSRYEFTLDGGKIEPQRDNPPVENMWTALSPLTIYSITR